MLGPAKPRRLDQPIAISLEELVPTDHVYQHLEAKLDLSFVRHWARELYAEGGRPSIDPVIFFKLQLVMFFEGIRSERPLIETASLNLAHSSLDRMWYRFPHPRRPDVRARRARSHSGDHRDDDPSSPDGPASRALPGHARDGCR